MHSLARAFVVYCLYWWGAKTTINQLPILSTSNFENMHYPVHLLSIPSTLIVTNWPFVYSHIFIFNGIFKKNEIKSANRPPGFLINTGPDPLKFHKATKQACNFGPSSAWTPLGNNKAISSLTNTDLDPLENHKAQCRAIIGPPVEYLSF